jgi:hypothetical protein
MSKSNRIKYGFTLEFPAKPFTVQSLRAHGAHPSYITAYVRVKNAIKAGTIEVVGNLVPKAKKKGFNQRGRRKLLFQRVDAKTSQTTTPATV